MVSETVELDWISWRPLPYTDCIRPVGPHESARPTFRRRNVQPTNQMVREFESLSCPSSRQLRQIVSTIHCALAKDVHVVHRLNCRVVVFARPVFSSGKLPPPAQLASTKATRHRIPRSSSGHTFHMTCPNTSLSGRIRYPFHRFQPACEFALVALYQSRRSSLDSFAYDW